VLCSFLAILDLLVASQIHSVRAWHIIRDMLAGIDEIFRVGGAQAVMADVAYPLSDEEIEALAHYLAHL